MSKKYQICLGHIKGTCPHCRMDRFNVMCPNYVPLGIYKIEVDDYEEQGNTEIRWKKVPGRD